MPEHPCSQSEIAVESALAAAQSALADAAAELAESKAIQASSASELHASVRRIAELEAELAESKAIQASSASELHASVGRIAELEAELAAAPSEVKAVEAAITESTKAKAEKDWARKIGKAAAEKAAANRAAAATEKAAKYWAAVEAAAEKAAKEVAEKAAAEKAATDKAAADKAAKAKAAKDVGKKAEQLMVLEFSLKCRMNPLQLGKAGAIVTNMQAAGFGEEHINTVCKALFLDQDDEGQMKQAWFVFTGGKAVQAAEFKKSLLMIDEIDEMFKKADTNGSGEIDFDQFVKLIKQMNAYGDNSTDNKVPAADGEKSDGMFGGLGGFSPW